VLIISTPRKWSKSNDYAENDLGLVCRFIGAMCKTRLSSGEYYTTIRFKRVLQHNYSVMLLRSSRRRSCLSSQASSDRLRLSCGPVRRGACRSITRLTSAWNSSAHSSASVVVVDENSFDQRIVVAEGGRVHSTYSDQH